MRYEGIRETEGECYINDNVVVLEKRKVGQAKPRRAKINILDIIIFQIAAVAVFFVASVVLYKVGGIDAISGGIRRAVDVISNLPY